MTIAISKYHQTKQAVKLINELRQEIKQSPYTVMRTVEPTLLQMLDIINTLVNQTSTNDQGVVTVNLTPEHAHMLKSLVQNPLNGQHPAEESVQDSQFRRAIFDQLDWMF